MALIISKPKDGDFEPAPQGTHISRCYMIVDEGIQETKYGPKHMVRIGWELPNELMKDGRPFVVSKEYNASLHPDTNLAKDLIAWRGKSFTEDELSGFDIFKVIKAPCMLTIIHNIKNEKTYANITSVTAIPKGTQVPELINNPLVFSITEPDEIMFKALPEWLRKKINRTASSQTSQSENPAAGVDDDSSIPF